MSFERPAESYPPSRSPFSHPAFRLYWSARFLSAFATQIISVAVGWQLYDATRDPWLLGLVGLVQFLPGFALVLVTGSVADRYNRRTIMALCIGVETLAALALLGLAVSGTVNATLILAILALIGLARAFIAPAAQALVANVVPAELLPAAIGLNSSSWQIATIVGPVAGGLLYGLSHIAPYATATVLFALAAVAALAINTTRQALTHRAASSEELFAGFRYIWQQPVVLGAISLDLFAVLLGGATALLPVYARDILDVGPWGLGLMRAAPGIGAIAMTAWLMRYPVSDHAGAVMFSTVGFFGLVTIAFGVSTLPWVSILALGLLGAADMISVVIRETLIQLATPDALRGRVNAVNMTFVGASNELGEFRAGTMAFLIGAVPAVVFGGIGTIFVAVLWAKLFPQLLRARRLDGSS